MSRGKQSSQSRKDKMLLGENCVIHKENNNKNETSELVCNKGPMIYSNNLDSSDRWFCIKKMFKSEPFTLKQHKKESHFIKNYIHQKRLELLWMYLNRGLQIVARKE